jgi:hypothetical protein
MPNGDERLRANEVVVYDRNWKIVEHRIVAQQTEGQPSTRG